jgi:hypothetical protein
MSSNIMQLFGYRGYPHRKHSRFNIQFELKSNVISCFQRFRVHTLKVLVRKIWSILKYQKYTLNFQI